MKISGFSFNYDKFFEPFKKDEGKDDKFDLDVEVTENPHVQTEQWATQQGATCMGNTCGFTCGTQTTCHRGC
jgi:hypothetical protein